MRIKTLASDAAPSFATAEDVKPERTMREDMLDVACRFDVRRLPDPALLARYAVVLPRVSPWARNRLPAIPTARP